MECHVDPGSVECPEIVIKELPRCAHKAKMPCNTDPNTIACVQMVKKALIPCGHIQELKCSADVSKINCREVVSKRIERCGHSKDMACSMDPCEFKCTSQVDRVLPKCGHVRKLKCSADPEKHQCDKIVRKRLPCDHEINMKCCITPSKSTRCQVKMQIPRETCSHTVDIECSKKTNINPNELKCYKPTQQQLMCGHTRSVECWMSDVQQPCQRKCSVTLLCGHPCGGKCRTCSDSLFHETCKESCRKLLICGHTCDNRKCGSCRPCNNLCANYCPHHHCTHGCASECSPCEEKCSLVCPHHQCSRLCSEQCDRPPCDRRCRLVLDCQHRCMGFCGEPCPASCIACGTKHIQDGISHEPPSEDTRLVRLTDCGHEFDSNYLDRIADGITNTLDIMRCPKCNTIVRWHPRYVNVLKMQRKAIDSVKTLLNVYDTQGRIPKTVFPKEIRDEINLYITRFHTYLYIQEKLHHEKTDAKLLTRWALPYIHMFAKLLNNSHQNIEMTPEQVHCINRNMCKLSAVWLLLIGSQWENRTASSEPSVAAGTTGQTSGDQSMKNITREQKALNAAEDLIRKEHSFATSDLHKVREILEPLLVNASEAIIAFDFPVLVAVGIHRDDWIICDEGHSTPSNIWSKKTCQECSSVNLLKQHGLVDGGANGEAGCGRGQSRGYGRGRGRVRSRGNVRGGHGEPVRSPENITLDFQGGERIEKSPQHNGSTRGRGRGSQGRGRGGGLERSRGQGKDRRGMGDSVKVDFIQNSEGHREKSGGKNGRECCGEIVEENRKERGGTSEREHDKWSDGKCEGAVAGQNKREHGRGGHGGRGRGDKHRESRGGHGSVRGGKGRNVEGGEGGHDRVIKDVSTGGNQERGRGLYDKVSRGGHGGGRGGRPGGRRGGGGGSKRVSVEGDGKGNSEVCAGVYGRGSQEQLDGSSKGVRGGDNEGGCYRGHRGGSRGGYGRESRGGRGRERGGGRGSYRVCKGEVGGNWSGDGGHDGISKRVNGGEDEGRDRGPDEESRGHGGEHGGIRDKRTKGGCGEGSEAGDGADRGGESKRGRGGWSNGGSRGGRGTGSRGGRGTGSRGGRGTGRRGGRGGISS